MLFVTVLLTQHLSQSVKMVEGLCGGQNLSLCVGLKVPLFNNKASEEKKAWEKAP